MGPMVDELCSAQWVIQRNVLSIIIIIIIIIIVVIVVAVKCIEERDLYSR